MANQDFVEHYWTERCSDFSTPGRDAHCPIVNYTFLVSKADRERFPGLGDATSIILWGADGDVHYALDPGPEYYVD